MIRELLIHLGDTKTGSTSIQNTLLHKAYDVPGKSIFYPTASNHIGLARTLSRKRLFPQRAGRFERVRNALQESNADFGVVSAEHFQFVDPQVLYDAIETYWPNLRQKIRLVAYVRPHADMLLSLFSERVKLGDDFGTLEDFAAIAEAQNLLLYQPRFEKWRAFFGDRFELRPFLRSHLFRGDVVHDFFHVLLQSEDFDIPKSANANSSLTVSQLALLRETTRALNDTAGETAKNASYHEARSDMARLLADHVAKSTLGAQDDKLRLPADLARRIKDRYAKDAEALDTGFFNDFPMSNALEKADRNTVATAQSLDASDYFSRDAIVAFHTFAQMLNTLFRTAPERTRSLLIDAYTRKDET
ncbi:MAG: hypothetical protein GYB25_08125 [Rhodobacteraceae bacterium]|nr:hypothetical protein [Paracoccaceae bacterium]